MSTHELKNAGCSKHRPKSLHFFILKSSRKRAAKNREHFTNLASNGPISVDFPKNIGFIIFSISELTKQRFLNHLNYKSNSFFKFFLMWTIFKIFIEFVTILLLFYVFWPRGCVVF